MKIKETRIMTMDDLRNLCIKENWYTCGDCEEYDNLLNMTKNGWKRRNITANVLYKMAIDIEQHSDMTGILDTETIMCMLAEICHTNFEIEK